MSRRQGKHVVSKKTTYFEDEDAEDKEEEQSKGDENEEDEDSEDEEDDEETEEDETEDDDDEQEEDDDDDDEEIGCQKMKAINKRSIMFADSARIKKNPRIESCFRKQVVVADSRIIDTFQNRMKPNPINDMKTLKNQRYSKAFASKVMIGSEDDYDTDDSEEKVRRRGRKKENEEERKKQERVIRKTEEKERMQRREKDRLERNRIERKEKDRKERGEEETREELRKEKQRKWEENIVKIGKEFQKRENDRRRENEKNERIEIIKQRNRLQRLEKEIKSKEKEIESKEKEIERKEKEYERKVRIHTERKENEKIQRKDVKEQERKRRTAQRRPHPNTGDMMHELRVKDASIYLDDVKREFKDRPSIYNEFLAIMKNFKSQIFDIPGLIARICKLFQGYNSLILGFNAYLLNVHKISMADLERLKADRALLATSERAKEKAWNQLSLRAKTIIIRMENKEDEEEEDEEKEEEEEEEETVFDQNLENIKKRYIRKYGRCSSSRITMDKKDTLCIKVKENGNDEKNCKEKSGIYFKSVVPKETMDIEYEDDKKEGNIELEEEEQEEEEEEAENGEEEEEVVEEEEIDEGDDDDDDEDYNEDEERNKRKRRVYNKYRARRRKGKPEKKKEDQEKEVKGNDDDTSDNVNGVDDKQENCKKDGNELEYGARPPPSIQEKDATLLACIADMKLGLHDPKKIRKKYPGTYTRHRQSILELIRDYKRPKEPPLYPLRIWQADLYAKLRQPPNDRAVVFIVDPTGKSGKTWFHRYYRWLHPEKTQMLPNSIFDDMALLLSEGITTLFIDLRRGDTSIDYYFLKAVIDGKVNARTYHGRVKSLDRCHVVVFAKLQPTMANMEELSIDRFDIINIDASMNLAANIPEPVLETTSETQTIIDMDNDGCTRIRESEVLVNREVFDLSQL